MQACTQARAGGAGSLAAPALARAAAKVDETARHGVRSLRGSPAGQPGERSSVALSVALEALARRSRALGEAVEQAVRDRSDQALGEAIARFEAQSKGEQSLPEPQGCARLPAAGLCAQGGEDRAGRSRTRERDGATMLEVPAGPFVRGAEGEQAEVDEYPRKLVEVAGFWIDSLEVSAGQYGRCVKEKACAAASAGASCNVGERKGRHPANCVSWTQASSYCTWAGARLPTEAEWEKAARGCDGRSYPWGEEPPDCERAMWFDPQRGHGCGTHSTAVVGSHPKGASPYGALDMAGNVWEWVQDRYVPAWDQAEAGAAGRLRVLRGGGWGKDGLGSLRTTSRLRLEGGLATPGTGFRCAMDAMAAGGEP
jgi:formylglycine-generating enzyme required for sulfatase activity